MSSTRSDIIARELRGETPIERAPRKSAPEGWMYASEAARRLGITLWAFARLRKNCPTAIQANGRTLFLRADVDRLFTITRQCRLAPGRAARVLAALKVGPL